MKFEIETTKTLILFVPQILYEYLECFDWSFDFAISDFLQFRKAITNGLLYLDEQDEYTESQKVEIKQQWIELNQITYQNEFDGVLIRRQI